MAKMEQTFLPIQKQDANDRFFLAEGGSQIRSPLFLLGAMKIYLVDVLAPNFKSGIITVVY